MSSYDGCDGFTDRRPDLGDFFFDVLRGAPQSTDEVFRRRSFAAIRLLCRGGRKHTSRYEKEIEDAGRASDCPSSVHI